MENDKYKTVFEFDSMIGHRFQFYGVDNNRFKLDSIILEAEEDPDDGYRSYFRSVVCSFEKEKEGIFFKKPLAEIEIQTLDEPVKGRDPTYSDGNVKGYKFVDVVDGHIWLEFGTDYSESYYPNFYFRYHPKEPK